MRILICDDEEAICRIVQVTLEPRGHRVDIASNVEAAITLFDEARRHDDGYELIIADVYMPAESGFYLAGYVRGTGYTGRLAVLTGAILNGNEPEFANMAKVGAEYWPKPLAMGNLIERVEGKG